MIHQQELKRILTDIDARIKTVSSQVVDTPNGTLSLEDRRGVKTFVLSSIKDGTRRRISLRKQPDLVKDICRNILIKEELDVLEHNKKVIQRALRSYKEFSPAKASINIQIQFKGSPIDLGEVNTCALSDDGWANQPFEQSTYKPEAKRHITSRGLKVRSKSEMLIAEKLYEYNIAFHYEQVIHDNGFIYAPDFTIRRTDGKFFYLEHMGMTNVKEYLDRQFRKIQQYISIGITPWDNLIITYDNEQGDLDLRIVESEIRNRLMPF